MALLKCSDCGGDVSDSPDLCPHCGKKYASPGSPLWTLGQLVIFACIVIITMKVCGAR